MSAERVLLKKGLRSDRLWTNRFIYNSSLAKIPFRWDAEALWQSQYWPREKLNTFDLIQRRRVLQNAARMPFWCDRFTQASFDPAKFNEEDWMRLPILTKQHFFDSTVEEYTDATLLSRSTPISTSGSTGIPLTFYHDPAFLLRSGAISERLFHNAGNGVRYPIIVMTARSDMGFGLAPQHYFYIRGYSGVRHRLDEFLALCTRFPDGVIVFGLSSSLLELARLCKERGVRPKIRCILAAAEGLTDLQRTEIEEALQTEVRTSYGMSEVRRLGSQCEHGRVHVNEESVHFEVIDHDGNPIPPEHEGNLLVTGLINTVMPFIRYKTGDRAALSDAPCACGRTLRSIQLHGRQTDFITFEDGRSVAIVDVTSMFNRFASAVRRFQLLRTDEFSFTVNIIPGPDLEREKDAIVKMLTRMLHTSAVPSLCLVDAIAEGQTGKAIYFIDQRSL